MKFNCKVFSYTSYYKNSDHTKTICHLDNIDILGVFCIIINFESCCADGSPQVQRHRTRENIYVVTMNLQSANTQDILEVFQVHDGNAIQTDSLESQHPWTSMDVHSDLKLLDYYLWDTLTFTTKCEYKCYWSFISKLAIQDQNLRMESFLKY